MESFNKDKTGRSKINHQNTSFISKFLFCFKPVSSVHDSGGAASFSAILSSALMEDCREGTDGWRHYSMKKGDDNHHNGFWHILKKSFNDIVLVKKIKRRKAANKSKISGSNVIMKLEKNSKQECKSSLVSSNSSALLFTPSSLSSSTNSSSSSHTLGSSSSTATTTLSSNTTPKPSKDKKKETNHDADDDEDRTKALCYILVTSLFVLILWGKVCAIICISFWLYHLPRRREQSEPPVPAANKGEEEFDTLEYKKKIIMEGLLERNRSRLVSNIDRPFV